MKPRSILAALSLTLVLSGAARADLVMIQETSVGEVKSRTTMYISGSKLRSDNGTETSVIMDTDTGDMTTLMQEQKMVMKVTAAELKAATAALSDKPQPELPMPKLTATGQKEKVQGYDCEIYISELMGTKTKMWVAKDYPGYDKLKKGLAVAAKMGAGAAKAPEIPGMTLRYEYEQQGLKFVTNLVSITEKPVDASLFTVPTGYKAPGE